MQAMLQSDKIEYFLLRRTTSSKQGESLRVGIIVGAFLLFQSGIEVDCRHPTST
jgi:hypothetical protein